MTTRVWWTPLAAPGEALLAVLSPVERSRAEAYARADHGYRSALGAGLLRRTVGEWLGVPPVDVRVRRACPDCGGPHGPPLLDAHGLHASITHAGGLVGVAVSDAGPVGLDVEPRTAKVPPDQLLLHDLTSTDPVEAWVAQEAYLKATGDGWRQPPPVGDLGSALARRGWTLERLRPDGDHLAALVGPDLPGDHDSRTPSGSGCG